MIHGIGRLEPDKRKLKSKLITIKNGYLKGHLTKEEYEQENSRIQSVIDRIEKEKHIRTK
jgi:hypothetical protein